jgi:hypothetical protein
MFLKEGFKCLIFRNIPAHVQSHMDRDFLGDLVRRYSTDTLKSVTHCVKFENRLT